MNNAKNKNLIKKKDARKEFTKSGDKKLKKTTYSQKIITKRTQVIFSQSQNLNFKDKYKNENEVTIKTKFIKGEPKMINIGKKINR